MLMDFFGDECILLLGLILLLWGLGGKGVNNSLSLANGSFQLATGLSRS